MSKLLPNVSISEEDIRKVELLLKKEEFPELFQGYGFLTALACGGCSFNFNRLLKDCQSGLMSRSPGYTPRNLFDLAQKVHKELVQDFKYRRFKLFREPILSSLETEVLAKKSAWSKGFFQAVFMFFKDWPVCAPLTRPLFYIASLSMDDEMLEESMVINKLSFSIAEVRHCAEVEVPSLVCDIYHYWANLKQVQQAPANDSVKQ